MNEKRMKALCGRLVNSAPTKYTDEEIDMLAGNPEYINRAVENALDEVLARLREENLLLDFVEVSNTPATTKQFVACEKFKLKKDGGLFSFIEDQFASEFLPLVYETIGELPVVCHRLRKNSRDPVIINTIGGEEFAETTLMDIIAKVEKQPNGEDGELLTNGRANIFYVKNFDGVLRAVCVRWFGGGWRVRARPVGLPREWDDGDLVFSRNSVLAPLETVS